MPKKIAKSGFRNWKTDRLPDLSGKTFFITGGNSGIGFEAAKYLGGAGGDLIIAARNPDKAARAVAALNGVFHPIGGESEAAPVDLAMRDVEIGKEHGVPAPDRLAGRVEVYGTAAWHQFFAPSCARWTRRSHHQAPDRPTITAKSASPTLRYTTVSGMPS